MESNTSWSTLSEPKISRLKFQTHDFIFKCPGDRYLHIFPTFQQKTLWPKCGIIRPANAWKAREEARMVDYFISCRTCAKIQPASYRQVGANHITVSSTPSCKQISFECTSTISSIQKLQLDYTLYSKNERSNLKVRLYCTTGGALGCLVVPSYVCRNRELG